MPATKKQRDLIQQAYDSIPQLSLGGFRMEVREYLQEMTYQEEKRHRHGERRAPQGFSITCAAKYFTVKRLREAAVAKIDSQVPPLSAFLHWQGSAFAAAAVEDKFPREINTWLHESDKTWGPEFDKLDYAKLMQET